MKKRWLTVLLALLLFMCGVQMTVSAGTSVSKILVSQKPTKTVYTVGDTLNTAGMKLKVTCSDGTSKEISSGFTCSPTKLTAAGNTWITVKYGGTATAFNVKVGKKIKSVTITKKPTKLTYTVGDTFNASGMKLKVTYTDNTTAEVTSGWTCTPTKLNTAGQQKITVKYGTGATGFYVKVGKKIKSVTITKKPTKLTYTVGDTFNASGMKLKVTYTDNTTAEVTSGWTCTPTKLNTAGQQKITVKYGTGATGFYVKVSKKIKSVTITKKPTKLTYTVGDAFNASGMKLKVTYTDDTTAEVTSGWTCTPTKLNTAGQQKITVKYGTGATGFYVKVSKKIKSVTITKKPTKLTYTVGDTFNASGMKLKVTYTDNTTAEVTSGWTCTPTKLNTAGQQKITVKYGTGATGFYVTVSETSNLPKLTNSNAAQVLKKQLWWFAGFMNCFAGNFYEDDYFYDSDNDYIYYRSRDCNNKADYVKLMRNYLIISDEYINLVFDFKEVNNHLYVGVPISDSGGYYLNSVKIKEYKDGAYYITADWYGLGNEYNTTDILKVVIQNGKYKIQTSYFQNYQKSNVPTISPTAVIETVDGFNFY